MLRRARRSQPAPPRRPRYVVDIEIADGGELVERLRKEGLAADEVIFKCLWPRYAPPADAGIFSLLKTENLAAQFDRLVALHRVVPSGIPLPVGLVRNTDGELVGYIVEQIDGETLHEILDRGGVEEARRQLDAVERIVAKLHAKSLPHGDLNAANILAAYDGRTVLIDPVATPGPGTMLQDELCLEELRKQLPG